MEDKTTRDIKALCQKVRDGMDVFRAYHEVDATKYHGYLYVYMDIVETEIQENLNDILILIPEEYRKEGLVTHNPINPEALDRLYYYIEQAYAVFESLAPCCFDMDNACALRYLSMTCEDLQNFLGLYCELYCDEDEDEYEDEYEDEEEPE